MKISVAQGLSAPDLNGDLVYKMKKNVSRVHFSDQIRKKFIPGCLRSLLSWFSWWVSFALDFQCGYFCESSCLFYPSFNIDFYVSKIMHL